MEKEKEKEQVKLVKSQNSQDQYHILLNKKVGEGAFGTVYEAKALNDMKRKLVVKCMKIDDENKRKTIDKQLKIMSELPAHQNIVSVIPLKMYSANNYYIFMEYCNGGTLYDLAKSKKESQFSQDELYDIFYQCMNGYKILFDKKILHQDIKPGNILIRNNVYKLADFGLSIFYETHKFGLSRQGTLSYISLQKLTTQNYVGNPKADVYAFGVMFYQFITGHHPYILSKAKKNLREYVLELMAAKLIYPSTLSSRYSLRFNDFFELIMKMLKKTQKERISFEQIWTIVRTSDLFQKSRQKQKQITKSFFVQQYDFFITQITNVLVMPVDILQNQENNLRKELESKVVQSKNKMMQLGKQVADYFIKRRMFVYYLDRLARKLTVEQLKMKQKNPVYDKSIICLTLLTKSLLNDLVEELRTPHNHSAQSLVAFKKTHSLANEIKDLLIKDHHYVEDSLCQLLAEPSSLIPKKELKAVFHLYKQHDQKALIQNLQQHLNELLTSKIDFIEVGNRTHLMTLSNILSIESTLADFQKSINNIEQLQKIDKKIMISSTPDLIGYIENECSSKGMMCGFDMSGVYENEELVTFQTEQTE